MLEDLQVVCQLTAMFLQLDPSMISKNEKKKIEEGEKNKVSKNVDSIYTKKKLLWLYVLFVVVFAINLYFNFSRKLFPNNPVCQLFY